MEYFYKVLDEKEEFKLVIVKIIFFLSSDAWKVSLDFFKKSLFAIIKNKHLFFLMAAN